MESQRTYFIIFLILCTFSVVEGSGHETTIAEAAVASEEEDLLQACNNICSCEKQNGNENKDAEEDNAPGFAIVCDTIWKVKTLNEKFTEEKLNGSSLDVSDENIISIRTGQNENTDNNIYFDSAYTGLRGLKKLKFNAFPVLNQLENAFFTTLFPNLESLHLGENDVFWITLGPLINLKEFIIRTSKGGIFSCFDAYLESCFHPSEMTYVEVNTMKHSKRSLVFNIKLPRKINEMKIHSENSGVEFVINSFTVNTLTVELKDIKQFFRTDIITVNENFFLSYTVSDANMDKTSYDPGIPSLNSILKKTMPYKILSNIYKNPSLKNHLVIKAFPSETLPVILPSCYEDCINNVDYLDEIVYGDVCAEEKKLLQNENFPEKDDGIIWYRAFEVDLTEIIKKVNENSPKEGLTVIVNAYYIYISESMIINFNLQVYYTVMKQSSKIIYKDIGQPSELSFLHLKTYAERFTFATTVDALYMQSYAKCTASIIASYKGKSMYVGFQNSKEWDMYLAFPKVVEKYEANNLVDSERAASIHVLVTQYLSMLAEQDSIVRRVPYLSMNLQGEVTEILLQNARDFQTNRNKFYLETKLQGLEHKSTADLKTLLDGQNKIKLLALELSMQQSKSLGQIAARKRDDIKAELDKINSAIDKLNKTSIIVQEEVKTATKAFEAGSKRRQIEAYAEVAMAVTSTFISFFTGGFDPSKIAKAISTAKTLATKLTKIFKVMELIRNLLQKLQSIKNILKKVKEFVSSRVGKLIDNLKKIKDFPNAVAIYGKALLQKASDAYDKMIQSSDDIKKSSKQFAKKAQSLQDIAEGIMAVNKAKKTSDAGFEGMKDFNTSKHMEAIEEGKNMDVSDVVQWDMTRDEMEGLLDASLSMEVPETTAYKAALFKFATVGKAITQLQIDEAKLNNDYATADFTYLKCLDDYMLMENQLSEIRQTMEEQKTQSFDSTMLYQKYNKIYEERKKDFYWEEFITKIQLSSNNMEFCNAYVYFHLEACPPELQFNVLDSIDDIIKIQTMLLYHSKQELQNLYPAPQSFYNISMVFEEENNCQCVEDPLANIAETYTNKKKEKDTAGLEILENSFFDESISKCFPHKTKPYERKDEKDVMKKLLQCKMKNIETFKNNEIISWSIPINSNELFEDYERVRIDQIQVYLVGAKTDSGVIAVTIRNAGVSQDRFKGKVYKFYGEPWFKKFSYYSDDNIKNEGTVINTIEKTNVNVIVSTKIHEQFQGVYRIPTGFSTWTVEISKKANPGLDLSNLKRIEVIYSGSFIIGTTDYTMYSTEGYPELPAEDLTSSTTDQKIAADFKAKQNSNMKKSHQKNVKVKIVKAKKKFKNMLKTSQTQTKKRKQ